MAIKLTRRRVLSGAAVTGALFVANTPASARPHGRRRDVFTLGVASGDPANDGFVIWTRLAPQPLAEDGSGGMPSRDQVVRYEISDDPGFRHIAQRGVADALHHFGHSVHVEISGLAADREFWYRFRHQGEISPSGRARTTPARDSTTALKLAVASCANYEHGYYTAYRHIAEENADAVLFLGDYIYEFGVKATNNPRHHPDPEPVDLPGYRFRYSLYKTDADLQAAHAAAPWLPIWDDHEVDDSYAGLEPSKPDENFGRRRAAAYQAYYENMPLRRSSIPVGLDAQLYRRIEWGRLASIHLLDTRQFRDPQACGGGWQVGCDDANEPRRTLLGAQQEQWLLDGLSESSAQWQLLGQQVFFAPLISRWNTPGEQRSTDSWDGYTDARQRLLDGMVDRQIENPVVFTGDVHCHNASNVHADPTDPETDIIATELVTTSITSEGDGKDADLPPDELPVAGNPWLKFRDYRRGYLTATITADTLDAEFKVLRYVSTPGAPVETRGRYVVEAGQPGLQTP